MKNSHKVKQLGFQKGDVRKVCFNEQANMNKEKKAEKGGKKKHKKKVSKKGLMDKKQRRKMNFEREDKKTRTKTE